MSWSTLNTYKPMNRVSKKKLAEAPDRRRAEAFCKKRAGGRCEVRFSPNCLGVGQHGHEVRKTGQGGSRINPANMLWCCNACNTLIEDFPELTAKLGLTDRRDGKFQNYPVQRVKVLPVKCQNCGVDVTRTQGRFYECGCTLFILAETPGEGS